MNCLVYKYFPYFLFPELKLTFSKRSLLFKAQMIVTPHPVLYRNNWTHLSQLWHLNVLLYTFYITHKTISSILTLSEVETVCVCGCFRKRKRESEKNKDLQCWCQTHTMNFRFIFHKHEGTFAKSLFFFSFVPKRAVPSCKRYIP